MGYIDSYSGVKNRAMELNRRIDEGLNILVKQNMDWNGLANMDSETIAGYKAVNEVIQSFKELSEAYAQEMLDHRKALRDIQDKLDELKDIVKKD